MAHRTFTRDYILNSFFNGLQALVLPYYVQILVGTSALRTAQVAEIALNVTGIINLIMHVFLRSNADRLAIRAVETPWSDKRTIRVFGPSDLNIREHISHPVLWQEADHDHNSFVAKSEKGSQQSPTGSNYDAWSASGPLQHVVFPSPMTKAKANRPITPPLKISPVRQMSQNNFSYALSPTAASATARVSSASSIESATPELDLPLPPAPLFARKHDRSTSAQSSATVQIGLRLSYMNHALDPIEASPPSIIGLPMALRSADPFRDNEWSRPTLRASASSETLRDFEFPPSQSYKAENIISHEIFDEPQIVMPDPGEHLPRPTVAQQQAASVEPFLLKNQAFVAPRPAPPPPVPEPARVIDLSSSPGTGLTLPQQETSPRPIRKPQPAFPLQPINGPQPPVGLPKSPKPAPSWRPQNWTSPKDTSSMSPGAEPEAAPSPAALSAVSSGVVNTITPQVINRPKGWK